MEGIIRGRPQIGHKMAGKGESSDSAWRLPESRRDVTGRTEDFKAGSEAPGNRQQAEVTSPCRMAAAS